MLVVLKCGSESWREFGGIPSVDLYPEHAGIYYDM